MVRSNPTYPLISNSTDAVLVPLIQGRRNGRNPPNIRHSVLQRLVHPFVPLSFPFVRTPTHTLSFSSAVQATVHGLRRRNHSQDPDLQFRSRPSVSLLLASSPSPLADALYLISSSQTEDPSLPFKSRTSSASDSTESCSRRRTGITRKRFTLSSCSRV